MLVGATGLTGAVAKLLTMSDQQQLPPRPRKIPPHILRRRRIVAVIILLIILALIGWGIWALISWLTSDEDEPPEPTPTVTQTVTPSPTESATDDDEDDEETEASDDESDSEELADACDPEFLTVTGATDQGSYAADETPVFTMEVTHDGDVVCDASLGSDQQNFVVEDADGEFVFSTRACQVDPQEQIVEMEPGQTEAAEFQWERVSTDQDCESLVEDVEPGEYRLIVSMGERTADPVSFELE